MVTFNKKSEMFYKVYFYSNPKHDPIYFYDMVFVGRVYKIFSLAFAEVFLEDSVIKTSAQNCLAKLWRKSFML